MSSSHAFAERVFHEYDTSRITAFTERHFSPEACRRIFRELAAHAGAPCTLRPAGTSFEGRPIELLSTGSGAIPILLWTQMHGDEPTATMALADALYYLHTHRTDETVGQILSALTIHALPMLNPDGAARIRRRTAQGIDMNRDAVALATPEARILRTLQRELAPLFGFNLHDQELSTVGATREITALALLAPAYDSATSVNGVRRRAKQLAAFLAEVAAPHLPGKLARYDDAFEPRAFGDNMQLWGTSTVLIESGHMPGDAEKTFIRKVHCAALLGAFAAIATGEFAASPLERYETLPFNGKKAYEIIIRNSRIDFGEGRIMIADLALSSQVDTHYEPPAKLVDIGDLSTFTAVMEVFGTGTPIPASLLELGKPFAWESFV